MSVLRLPKSQQYPAAQGTVFQTTQFCSAFIYFCTGPILLQSDFKKKKENKCQHPLGVPICTYLRDLFPFGTLLPACASAPPTKSPENRKVKQMAPEDALISGQNANPFPSTPSSEKVPAPGSPRNPRGGGGPGRVALHPGFSPGGLSPLLGSEQAWKGAPCLVPNHFPKNKNYVQMSISIFISNSRFQRQY